MLFLVAENSKKLIENAVGNVDMALKTLGLPKTLMNVVENAEIAQKKLLKSPKTLWMPKTPIALPAWHQ